MHIFEPLTGALDSVGIPYYHFSAPDNAQAPYIVWGEDSQSGSMWADGRMQSQVIEGTIDFFTKMEYDPAVMEIQRALNGADIPWQLDLIDAEEDTNLIHYQWIFEVLAYG